MEHDPFDSMGFALRPVAPGDPGFDFGMFVRGVIVDDQMKGQVDWRFPIQLLEESQPLTVSVFGGGSAENLPIQIGEGGKKRDRAMSFVIMSFRAWMAAFQRQAWLGPFQGLALAFLIAAQDQRSVGWIKIQADHIPELLFKLFVVREFERSRDVRLDLIGAPEPLHGGFGDPYAFGHGAHRPSRTIRWRLSGPGQDLLTNLHVDLQFASGPFAFHQTRQAAFHEPVFPLNDHGPAQTGFFRGFALAQPIGPVENDPSSLVFPLRRRWPIDGGA